ncbi:hypothetical protein AVEN_222483-1 [Araneus ventricosus]|uniref:Uncharacterized protein n=1 Tax=Araneus ventricosus TaxID=182803 RepID=A0A4Y2Q109_ARAVE|nr:hypothetical protein AVEN_222483-1 [Araneus ventricosus]
MHSGHSHKPQRRLLLLSSLLLQTVSDFISQNGQVVENWNFKRLENRIETTDSTATEIIVDQPDDDHEEVQRDHHEATDCPVFRTWRSRILYLMNPFRAELPHTAANDSVTNLKQLSTAANDKEILKYQFQQGRPKISTSNPLSEIGTTCASSTVSSHPTAFNLERSTFSEKKLIYFLSCREVPDIGVTCPRYIDRGSEIRTS